MRKMTLAAIAALALALPAHGQDAAPPALADGTQLRADDAQKLADLDTHVGGALRAAFAGGQPADIAALTGALTGRALPADAALEALKGSWTCRMMKAGDMLTVVVYDKFDCSFDGGTFAKRTGSQQTTGAVHRDDGRLIYLGTGFVQGAKAPAYADLPDDPLSAPGAGQIWADIAVVEVVSPRRARLIFPDPALESQLNVLEMTR